MIGSVGLVVASSMSLVAAEPTSIRINLVAEVPVTCSTGAVLQSQTTASGLRAALAGTCNADHVVQVTLVDPENARAAQLNGESGLREQESFRFLRSAYFSPISVLEIDFADMPLESSDPGAQIRVEISPF